MNRRTFRVSPQRHFHTMLIEAKNNGTNLLWIRHPHWRPICIPICVMEANVELEKGIILHVYCIGTGWSPLLVVHTELSVWESIRMGRNRFTLNACAAMWISYKLMNQTRRLFSPRQKPMTWRNDSTDKAQSSSAENMSQSCCCAKENHKFAIK